MQTRGDSKMTAEREAMRSEFAATITEVKVELAKMKTDVLKWVIGALCVETIVIVSALVWFVKRIVQ